MTPSLKILQPGAFTTVQDIGRFGQQRAGIPSSGALDAVSLRIANHLVGNDETQAALEILINGPTIEVAADMVRVALAGDGVTLELLGDRTATIPPWRSVTLSRGQTFRISALKGWSCAYLAISGGIDIPSVLGSRSTYVRAGIGGFKGRTLQPGDHLPVLNAPLAAEEPDRILTKPPGDNLTGPIRVILGPQDDAFTTESIAAFLSEPYRVSPNADRMGFRLEGAKLNHKAGFDIASDGIAPGAIQVPGTGLPIILLADRQTTGGYPKIATVISADIPAVSRRRPGSDISFEAVDLETARSLRITQERDIAASLADHVEEIAEIGIIVEALYNENLISGIVSEEETET